MSGKARFTAIGVTEGLGVTIVFRRLSANGRMWAGIAAYVSSMNGAVE